MPTRKAHNKSRRGCLTCKKRHVKCDESGPPCGTCAARDTPCEYPPLLTRLQQRSACNDATDGDEAVAGAADHHVERHGKAADGVATQWSDRSHNCLVELELMHRWSTSTYKSMCRKTASDREACQVMVPLLALRHKYLLHSLFAVSALEIAASEPTSGERVEEYVRIATEHQAHAIQDFRAALVNIESDSQEALLFCSSSLMLLSLASSRYPDQRGKRRSIIEQILTHVQMVRGMGAVFETDPDLINRSVLLQNFPEFEDLPAIVPAPGTAQAFDYLSRWNESRSEQAGSFEFRLKSMSNKVACQKAIFWLRECFSRSLDGNMQAYILALPAIAGTDFVDAIQARDAPALVVLVFWGVLFERASKDYWWAKRIGVLLLEEVTDALRQEDNKSMRYAIEWAREQISLAGGV